MPLFAKLMHVLPAASGSSVEHFDRVEATAQVLSFGAGSVDCQTCGLSELCLPVGLSSDQMKLLDALIVHWINVRRHNSVYRAGERFHALFAIRTGSLKTVMHGKEGREQVLGYHIPGDIVGIDGIALDRYDSNAIALEHTEICARPFAVIEDLARTNLALQRSIHQFMSRELMRNHNAMFVLGSMSAEERLIVFLLGLADRHGGRGNLCCEYSLTLTRQDIGSYLGLRIETVSRHFSLLQEAGLIQVQGRSVKLLDPVAMRKLVGPRTRPCLSLVRTWVPCSEDRLKRHFMLPRRYPEQKRKRPARRQAVELFGCGGSILAL